MKPSEFRSKSLKNKLTCCCLVLAILLSVFAAMTLPTYDVLPKANAGDEGFLPAAETENKMEQLAYFKFDTSTDRLEDSSGNNVHATIVDNDNGAYIIGKDVDGNYLDLTGSNAYLQLAGSMLDGLTEVTVEMRVMTKDDTKANWAFFAAPDMNEPAYAYEKYLGILLKDNVTVERYANSGKRPGNNPSVDDWDVNKWQTVRVVFAENSTTIYIDGVEKATENSTFSLKDCIGEGGVIMFGHATWGATGEGFNGYIDDITISGKTAGETDASVIASFDFEGTTVMEDKSGNGNDATAVGGITDISTYFDDDNNNTFLDLKNKHAYLSLKNDDGTGVLKGMTEVMIEMRVKTERSDKTQWVFYAAPNDAILTSISQNEYYLSVHLNNSANTAVARRYSDIRPNGPPNSGGLSAALGDFDWYTVKVIYEAGKTTLSVQKDGEPEAKTVYTTELNANIWDCVKENGVFWFGYSGWRGEQYFNGGIDDIKIWGTTKITDVSKETEDRHIITQNVIDPADTTVNMFDYWVFGDQNDRDYGRYDKTLENLVDNGINKEHLFVFDGSATFEIDRPYLTGGNSPRLGGWNQYGGTDFKGETADGFEAKQKIVEDTLFEDYPRLALANWPIPADFISEAIWEDKKAESLNYLFDPNIKHDGKASYPDVTGLFRVDNEGYYYFRSQDVYAELNAEQAYAADKPKKSTANNRITLYDTPWQEDYARGQFFPFNDWTKLFYEVNGNIGQWGDQGTQIGLGQPMNHWFGMTIETKLMQPQNGMLNNGKTPMIFDFSGDDDVWIFIDDVLVADVGGNHSRIRVTIDFSDGSIVYKKQLKYDGIDSELDVPKGDYITTSLREMFGAAGKENITRWSNNTFADDTIHTLKFFYLERGNAASNCNIRFNLQEPVADRIRKVDQNGDPLAGAEFELYKATTTNTIGDDEWWHTAEEFDEDGDPISTARSDGSGYALLTNEKGEPINFNNFTDTYYILKETKSPEGYRKNPSIVLKFHKASGTFKVVNKYEVGAYASFIAEWTSQSDICYAKYDNSDGKFSQNGQVLTNQLADGLAVVVPVFRTGDLWYPMYGSNTLGWNTVKPNGDSEAYLKEALAKAALMQIADTDPKTQDWYLRWNGVQFKGKMENLPGDATRYAFNNGNDGELVTLFLPKNALDILGVGGSFANDDDRYAALSNALAGKSENELDVLSEQIKGNIALIFTGYPNFEKRSRTVIYVPNEQRELQVRKVDENDDPIAGAEFALFKTISDARNSTNILASGTTDNDGKLVFSANAGNTVGHADINWDDDSTSVYWLKEISAPRGYKLNDSLIRIEVGDTGVYANATGYDAEGYLLMGEDGVKVEASLGRLTQTLIKYAEGIVDETLKHITATKQTAESGDITSWTDGSESASLTYDVSSGYDAVKFTAEDGFVRVMPRQNNKGVPTANRDILTNTGDEYGDPIDLDGLFSLINTVVVTDQTLPPTSNGTAGNTGSLTVKKTVIGGDTNESFTFTVTLSDDINGVYGNVSFKNGKASFTLKHGESVTFIGLPAGITYTVTEAEAEGYSMTSTGSTGTISANGIAEAAFINTRTVEADDTNNADDPDDPSDVDNSNEQDKPDRPYDNPNTANKRLSLWGTAITLSLIAAVRPLRKRGRHQK